MKLKNFPEGLRLLLQLMGRSCSLLFIFGIISSVVLSAIECVIAFFLVSFLCSLGFADVSMLPAWWPFDPSLFSSAGIWFLLLGIGLLQAGSRVIVYQSKIILTERIQARLKLMLGYLILKKERLYAMPLSRINYYMSECFPKATSFAFHVTQISAFAVHSLVMVAAMFWLAWREATVGFIGLMVIGVLVLFLNRFTNRISKGVPEACKRLETTKLRITRNWLLIKVLRLQEEEYNNFLQSIYQYYRHSVLAYFFGNLGGACMPVLGIVIIAAMVMTHFSLADPSPTEFVAFLYLFLRLQQRLANGSNMMGGLFTVRPQFLEVLGLIGRLSGKERQEAFAPESGFNLRSESLAPFDYGAADSPVSVEDVVECKEAPEITLDRVCLGWPDQDRLVLNGLSLRVDAGEQLGVVGPNGSGKSTLLGVLLGIYTPSSGDVSVGGMKALAYFEKYAASIAYVGPEPYLVHGSVRSNMVYGLKDSPDDKVLWQTLEMVGLGELLRSLPEGLGYVIHEDGAGLSSGEKQRLTIARAFLRNPRLLVLDEPSANLDEKTESAVVSTLKALKGRCTTIIVSHRRGILAGVDRTLELEDSL